MIADDGVDLLEADSLTGWDGSETSEKKSDSVMEDMSEGSSLTTLLRPLTDTKKKKGMMRFSSCLRRSMAQLRLKKREQLLMDVFRLQPFSTSSAERSEQEEASIPSASPPKEGEGRTEAIDNASPMEASAVSYSPSEKMVVDEANRVERQLLQTGAEQTTQKKSEEREENERENRGDEQSSGISRSRPPSLSLFSSISSSASTSFPSALSRFDRKGEEGVVESEREGEERRSKTPLPTNETAGGSIARTTRRRRKQHVSMVYT